MYYNNYCNCKCICRKKICSVSLEASDVLTITIPDTVFNNQDRIKLCVAQTVPAPAEPVQVILLDGAVKIPLVNQFGNFIYSDQINARTAYNITIATDSVVGIVTSCLPCTAFVAPQILPA